MEVFRTRIKKDIIAEVALPTRRSKKGDKVVILCPGLPSMPGKAPLLNFFARKGYVAIFLRYKGSWESNGRLLARSPEKDILDVLDSVSNGHFVDAWTGDTHRVTPRDIILIGVSFGGAAALLAAHDRRVNKVVVLSPVVDWTESSKAEPLSWLYRATKAAFGEGYRVSKANWNKLKKGTFFNPMHHVDEIPGEKVLIFHTKDDEVVRASSVAQFAKKTGSALRMYTRGGHLSLSSVMKPLFWRHTKRFFK